MSKGSKPAGNITMTNLTGQKQEPYLTEGWDYGKALLNQNFNNPFAVVPTAGENVLLGGLDHLRASASGIENVLQPQATSAWATGARGDIYNSPAYQAWQNLTQNATGPQQQLAGLGNQAAAGGQNWANAISQYANPLAANNNLGLSQLGKVASGEFLNSNPYFASMVQNALDPITRNYQTAIAPQLDANFANSGRYGSGAMLGARENAQNVLADQLAKTSSNMYGQNYANERQQQDQAAQQYGSLYNQGLTGAAGIQNTAGNQFMQGLNQAGSLLGQQLSGMLSGAQGLQGGYQSGNQNALSAAQMYPQLAQSTLLPAQTEMAAGQGFNEWQRQYLDAPYTTLKRYMDTIGQPIGAGTQQPYFQNQGANIMSGITGGLDIMSKIGGMGAMGGWIVCTELVRQGRMPKRYWAVGSCVFMQYPEVGKRGYHLWGIPLVRHLRRKPYSLLSRIACAAFNWRAEDLAARRGIKGARRRLRGRLVTWVLYPICMALGTVAPEQDWQQVYDADTRTAG